MLVGYVDSDHWASKELDRKTDHIFKVFDKTYCMLE